jgi:Peptidase family M48
MKPSFFLLFLCLPFWASGQSGSRFARTYTDTLPENFKLSSNLLREHIYRGIPNDIKNELYPRASFRFADQSAIQLSSLFSSGQVYNDWASFEQYLNLVVAKIMPPALSQDSVIHAYLVKDGGFNAFMTPSGILFVHIGLFDEIPNEAALAGILSHELAHYLLRHSLNRFVKAEKGEFERIFNKSSASRFSVQNEMQADSLAIVWMNQSGYGAKGFDDGIQAIQRLEKKRLLRLEDVWELKETTHPVSDRRLAQVDSLARLTAATSNDFLISRERFYAFREFAKSEALKYLLYNFEYDACIEKAFKCHILNPDRAEYVYFIMEGIRRKCYFNVDVWKQKFITDNYFKIIDTKNGKRKVKIDDNIFKANTQDILGMTVEEMQNLGAGFYWEGPVKFETYEEAFNFFAQVGELFKDPECILSNALSINFDPALRARLLEQYLTFDKARHKEYARHLLQGDIYTALTPKTLTVMSDFFATIRQGNEDIYIRSEKFGESNNLTTIAKAMITGSEHRKNLNLADIQSKKVNDYIQLLELKTLAQLRFYAKGEKTELHILDPRYWEFMHQYGINEVEFVDVLYYDARKAENSLEAYKEVVNTKLSELLTETKRHRYVQARVLAIRILPKSMMKLQQYGTEFKVDFNKPAEDKIIEYLLDQLREKDKTASQYDGKQE